MHNAALSEILPQVASFLLLRQFGDYFHLDEQGGSRAGDYGFA
jgi:hypothetical protein